MCWILVRSTKLNYVESDYYSHGKPVLKYFSLVVESTAPKNYENHWQIICHQMISRVLADYPVLYCRNNASMTTIYTVKNALTQQHEKMFPITGPQLPHSAIDISCPTKLMGLNLNLDMLTWNKCDSESPGDIISSPNFSTKMQTRTPR